MRQYLPEKEYEQVAQAMAYGGKISMQTADAVAKAMKDWAVERGATHYSHWFQPLTGATAEKSADALKEAGISNPRPLAVLREPDCDAAVRLAAAQFDGGRCLMIIIREIKQNVSIHYEIPDQLLGLLRCNAPCRQICFIIRI